MSFSGKDSELKGFHVFCDSDFASDPITRHSAFGFIVFYDGDPIYWRARKSTMVCLSSTHAELNAAFIAIKEVRWLFQIINDLRSTMKQPALSTMHLHQDNQSTMAILHSEFYPIKHWDVRYKALHELVQNNSVTLVYTPTDEMTADILTKPLPAASFQRHRSNMSLHP